MTLEQILDRVVTPRPNGSAALERVGDFLAHSLEQAGALTSRHEFVATPHGFQLVWSVTLLLMLLYVVAVATSRYRLALAVMLTVPALLLAEFELLLSPISGLAPATGSNIVGRFPARAEGPTLVLCAHYDSATHFGDHFSWGRWGAMQGPATGLALLLPLLGLWLRRRGRRLPRAIAVALAAAACLPFAAMFWFQSIGPIAREPSPGAVDNGGSVAALVLLAQELGRRDSAASLGVEIVFLAAEEERTLGSWAFAETLRGSGPVVVVNLESVGGARELAYVPEDGFALRRYRSPDALVELVNDTAEALWGAPLEARALPFGTLTDGRSFLARGIPALTLRAFAGGAFPRGLHSARDSRARLDPEGITRSVELLLALVDRVDREPALLAFGSRPGRPTGSVRRPR